MSELKFTCPLCGQRMECEKAYVGDTVECPGCSAELRVPFSHTPVDPQTSLPRAELIKVPEQSASTVVPPTEDNPFAESKALKSLPVPVGSKLSAVEDGSPSAPSNGEEIHFLCPACHAELIWPKDVVPIRCKAEDPPDSSRQPEGSHVEGVPIAEREKQIAAARESHPVSLYPSIKPRLSFILSGGEAVKPGKGSDSRRDAGEQPRSLSE